MGWVSRRGIGRDCGFRPECDPLTLGTDRRDPDRARDRILVVLRAWVFTDRHRCYRARLGDFASAAKVRPQYTLGISAGVLVALRTHDLGNTGRRERHFPIVGSANRRPDLLAPGASRGDGRFVEWCRGA